MERLDKFLSAVTPYTRSQIRDMVKAGRVTVNGAIQRDCGIKISPTSQEIALDGEILGAKKRLVVMLNKPAGYVTARTDATELTVMELLPPQWKQLHPIGRLDKATEGLLLLTDDGDLLHRLISPKKEVPKIYYARHQGQANQEDVDTFARGLELRDGTLCRPAVLTPLGPGESLITVCEGKYHQVRRMMAARNMTVAYLERRQEGGLTLGDLPRGQARRLTEAEIATLDEKVKSKSRKN